MAEIVNLGDFDTESNAAISEEVLAERESQETIDDAWREWDVLGHHDGCDRLPVLGTIADCRSSRPRRWHQLLIE